MSRLMADLQGLEGGRKTESILFLLQQWADAWTLVKVRCLLWPLGGFLQSIHLSPGASYKLSFCQFPCFMQLLKTELLSLLMCVLPTLPKVL